MRFLLDENVSYRICPHLKAAGHDVVHVAEIGLRAGQALQHAELLAGQGQRDTGASGPVPRTIDHQVAPPHDRG